jgi:hypothetical protein
MCLLLSTNQSTVSTPGVLTVLNSASTMASRIADGRSLCSAAAASLSVAALRSTLCAPGVAP